MASQPTRKADTSYSREYLEEALAAAQNHLPPWAIALIHQHALPRSGGRARGRATPAPDALGRVALRRLSPEDLAPLSDQDLLGTWGQLQRWYDGNPDSDLYQAAGTLMAEMERRGVQVDRSAGLGADATVAKAALGATALTTLAEALGWYAQQASVSRVTAGPVGVAGTPVAWAADLALVARRAMDAPRSPGAVQLCAGEARAVLHKSAYADLGRFVPTQTPARPPVAFVGAVPTEADALRGEPFCGPDGAALLEFYLAPLGLRKRDVLLTHVVPMVGSGPEAPIFDGWIHKELARHRPPVVVALGRVAKAALGNAAQFVLPHPAAVRRHGDRGEVARKLGSLRRAIAHAQTLHKEVPIAKADAAQQICYGVVLDPYQIDSQGDWIPAADIEKTAHDYLANSRVVGLQHGQQADAVVVESHLVQYPSAQDYQAAMANQPHRAYRMPYGNQTVHSGAWILGTKVRDPKVWQDIEKGAIGAYSIGGDGMRTPMQPTDGPKVQFIDLRAEMTPGAQLLDPSPNAG